MTSRRLHRLASRLRDLEALLSLDPRRIAARWYNKAVGRVVSKATRRLWWRVRR